MIVCKTCGHTNEDGAGFCGSCGSFLEWTGEPVEQPQPGTQPQPGGADAAGGSGQPGGGGTAGAGSGGSAGPVTGGPDGDAPTQPFPQPQPEPSPEPGSILCPACGQANTPDRTYCRRCATELRPAAPEPLPLPPPTTSRRAVPPMALLGGGAAVILVAAAAAFVLLPRGDTGPTLPPITDAPPSLAGPVASESPGTSGAPSGEPSPPASAPPSGEPPSQPPAGPTFTGEIVFSAERDGDLDLWVWDGPTEQLRRLVATSRSEGDASWSAGREAVVYRETRGLRMVRADGKPFSPAALTDNGQDTNPAWSPDGAWVVFASRRNGSSLDIYRRPADDNKAPVERLVSAPGNDWDPQWSPDGDEIIFASARNGDSHLYLMGSDGRGETEIPLGRGIYDDPSWSPDGEWIAFTRRANANSHKVLYIARPDGTEMRRMTDSDVDENDMAWSPDGNYLVLARDGRRAKLVIIEVASGREVARVGVDGAVNRQPDWR